MGPTVIYRTAVSRRRCRQGMRSRLGAWRLGLRQGELCAARPADDRFTYLLLYACRGRGQATRRSNAYVCVCIPVYILKSRLCTDCKHIRHKLVRNVGYVYRYSTELYTHACRNVFPVMLIIRCSRPCSLPYSARSTQPSTQPPWSPRMRRLYPLPRRSMPGAAPLQPSSPLP